MTEIVGLVELFKQSNYFPIFRTLVLGLIAAVTVAVQSDDVRRTIRKAIAKSLGTEKAAALECGISQGLLSNRLSGERNLSVECLQKLPAEFWQWWAVEIAAVYGVPPVVEAGARLKRRAARMSLHQSKKEGVA